MSSTVLYIPKSRHSELIGKQGANLRDWQSKFKVKITVPGREENSNEVIVSGKPDEVAATREEIEKLLKLNTKEPGTSWKLDIAQSSYSRLIGAGGSTLRNLQDLHHVRINVPRQGSKEDHVIVEGSESDLNALVTALEALLKADVRRVDSAPSSSTTTSTSTSGASVSSPPPSSSSPHAAQAKSPVLATGPINKVIFFPDHDQVKCPNIHEFLAYLGSANATLEICVFTITDDRIASTIIKSHAKGVKVRVITDNDQSEQLGSDIQKLRDAGVPVKMDISPFHMHHKFAIIDRALLLNGSFNWTKGASQSNCENIMITNTPDFVRSFSDHFETMWKDNENFK